VVASDVTALPSLTASSFGMHNMFWGAWSTASSPQLLYGGDHLVAVDAVRLTVKWSAPCSKGGGIAILHECGVAASDQGLRTLRLTDGTLSWTGFY